MHCPKPTCGPEFQLSTNHSSELYWEQAVSVPAPLNDYELHLSRPALPATHLSWREEKMPLRGCPHERALLQKCTCIASFWLTIHMDPENAAPEKALFWKRVSGWKNLKTQPSRFPVDTESAYFPKLWCHRPTPRPLASNLWPLRRLIRTTTTMADHMHATYLPCSWVRVAAAIWPR